MELSRRRLFRLRATRMNLPNSITMSRIVMIPLLLWILSPHFTWLGSNGEQEIAASVLFVLASITDGLDGYLARKRKQITTLGMLLDPIADKIMVTSALIALVAYNPQVVKVWIVVVIIGREFLISGLRAMHMPWKVRRQNPQQQRDHDDPAHRDGIGQVHAVAPHYRVSGGVTPLLHCTAGDRLASCMCAA